MTTQEQIILIDELLSELYGNRSTWGGGPIMNYLHKQSAKQLHIGGEQTFKRAAEVLGVPYKTLAIGGNPSKSYPLESALEVLHYIVETEEAQRRLDWLSLHPEEARKQLQNRHQGALSRAASRVAKQAASDWISFYQLKKVLSEQLGGCLGSKGLLATCQRLKFPIYSRRVCSNKSTWGILKSDIPKLVNYFKDTYPSDPVIRRYQMMHDTINSTSGKSRQMAQSRSKTRAASKLQAIKQLEQDLGEKVYDSFEAQSYVARNNSTLIKGVRLLQLPVYKRVGQFLYPQSSLDSLVKFYNAKNGLKGQLARAFEDRLRAGGYEFRCEKSYSDLRWNGGNPLRFDYYLPAYNLLVEVQGRQHFRPTTMGADISEEEMLKNFKELQERDALKVTYCRQHQIPLIVISSSEDFQEFDIYIASQTSNKES